MTTKCSIWHDAGQWLFDQSINNDQTSLEGIKNKVPGSVKGQKIKI